MHSHLFRSVWALIIICCLAAGPALADPLPEPSALEARIGSSPVPVEVYEPNLSSKDNRVKRSYAAYPFSVVAELMFGPQWRDGVDAVEFRALDGYVSRIPMADFKQHKAHLAVGLSDNSAFTVDNHRQNQTDIPLAPYYLIWENIDDPEIYARGASIWPYQVAAMLRVSISDAVLWPQGLDPALKPAVQLVRTHCLNCHNLNGVGGNKTPGDLAMLARALDDRTFRARVLDPRSVVPTSTMPPLSHDLAEAARNRIVELLRAYLLKMPGEG